MMEWRSWREDHGGVSWGLFDGEIELARIYKHPLLEDERWIWHLLDRNNIDAGIEGHEATLALAAYAVVAEMKNPSHPITLANVPHGHLA